MELCGGGTASELALRMSDSFSLTLFLLSLFFVCFLLSLFRVSFVHTCINIRLVFPLFLFVSDNFVVFSMLVMFPHLLSMYAGINQPVPEQYICFIARETLAV